MTNADRESDRIRRRNRRDRNATHKRTERAFRARNVGRMMINDLTMDGLG